MKRSLAGVWISLSLLVGTANAWAADYLKGIKAAQRGDYVAALQQWLPLAEQGDASSQLVLGTIYQSGKHVIQDYKEAVKWYRLAAAQGNADAQVNLGFMYSKGNGVSQDYKEAVKWYRLAAYQGHAEAQSALDELTPVEKETDNPDLSRAKAAYAMRDYATALRLYQPLAKHGDKRAQFSLGVIYHLGQGVVKNPKEAMKWFRLSAEQGNEKAQYALYGMYKSGTGTDQDFKKAVRWLRLAAEQGLPIAQKALGEVYYDGRGVLQNHVMAHMWFNIAASNGYEFSTLYRDRLAKLMTAADISKAQQLARECVAKKYKGC